MAEEEGVARLQVRLDGLLVHVALDRVRHQDHDDVGLGGGLGRGDDAQAGLLRLGTGLRALQEADTDVHARVAQRQRVGVALAAVADDRDLAALDDGQVGVVFVEQLGHGGTSPCVMVMPGGAVPTVRGPGGGVGRCFRW